MPTKAPLFVASLILSAWVGGAAAQSQGDQFSGIKQQLTAEKKALESEELKKLIAIERQKLMQQLQALEALEARVQQLESDKPAAAPAGQPQQPKPKAPPAAAVAAKTPSQPGAASTGSVGEDQKEQAEKDRVSEARKVAAVSDDVRGILTPRNTLTIEPSLKYTQTSTDRVFLEGFGPLVLPSFFLGVIDIRETDRKTWIAAVTARYGITNRLQVEAKVPYVWRDDSTRSRPISQSLFSDDVFDADGDDIGDIEFAVDYQINDGLGGWPFFTGSLRVKTDTGTDPYSVETFDVVPTDENGDCFTNDDGECLIQSFPKELATGTGTWSVQPSLTFLYPTDPAVFYGTVDYSFNLKNDFGGDIGEIDPGDAVG
ncbi:MAG: hypothetical protein WBM84_06330, partial [Sedimenticolaceae bacterium]